MALELLDGTSADVDVQITFSGATATSMRCVTTALEYRSSKSYQATNTLCAGKWRKQKSSGMQDTIRIGKLASQGDVASNTSVLMASADPIPVTVTLASGCTKSGDFDFTDDSYAVAAGFQAVPGDLIGISNDAVMTAWVIT